MVERVRIVDDIQTGEVVWAKLQDKKFAQAKVISTSKVTFYKALLSNNVYCPNFYPSEVLVSKLVDYSLFICNFTI